MSASKRMAFSYSRFSTPQQSTGFSLTRQLELAERFCAQNGWVLDPTLTFLDAGVSGFSGKHRKEGDFGVFLDLINTPNQTRIPPGSVLVVESVDRTSREKPRIALSYWLQILNKGIWIATTSTGKIYKPEASEFELMEALLEMIRAYKESERKSGMLKDAWERKRKAATAGNAKLTTVCPAWIDRETFQLIPERADLIRRMVSLAIDGNGGITISKIFNAEKIPLFTKSKSGLWTHRTINAILSNRALIGEMQPHLGKQDGNKPIGEPIKDYYPAVLDESEFYQVAESMAARYKHRGRKGQTIANLFTGVLIDAASGGTFVITQPRPGKRYLVQKVARYSSAKASSFPYNALEEGFLSWFKELDLASIIGNAPATNHEAKKAELEGKRGALQRKIDKLKDKLLGDEDFTEGLDLLRQFQQQRDELTLLIEATKAKQHTSHNIFDYTTHQLVDELKTAPADKLEQLRAKLKSKIRQMIDSIQLLVLNNPPAEVKSGGATSYWWRLAICQVWFKTGQHRSFKIAYRPQTQRNINVGAASLIGENSSPLNEYRHLKPVVEFGGWEEWQHFPIEVADMRNLHSLTEKQQAQWIKKNIPIGWWK